MVCVARKGWREVVFFFQAEDGMRDYKVTGVQTCALPISGVTGGSLLDGVRFRGDFAETETVVMRSKTGTVRRVKTTFRNIGNKLAMLSGLFNANHW